MSSDSHLLGLSMSLTTASPDVIGTAERPPLYLPWLAQYVRVRCGIAIEDGGSQRRERPLCEGAKLLKVAGCSRVHHSITLPKCPALQRERSKERNDNVAHRADAWQPGRLSLPGRLGPRSVHFSCCLAKERFHRDKMFQTQ